MKYILAVSHVTLYKYSKISNTCCHTTSSTLTVKPRHLLELDRPHCTFPSPGLFGYTLGLLHEDLWMVVNAWVEAETDGTPDGLGHLALVDRSEAGFIRVLYPPKRRYVLRYHGKVLSTEC
jgi:hypothetical protein